MHSVIIGCRRVGSLIAAVPDTDGHSTAVIDMDPKTFSRLLTNFLGRRVTGPGIDHGVLEQAGAKDAYAFATMSSGDNSNIIAARIAQEVFHVEHVVAKVYDPQHAFVYEHLGIPTAVMAERTVESVTRRILPSDASVIWTHPASEVSLVTVTPEESRYGVAFPTVEELTGKHIALVSCLEAIIPAGPDFII